MLRTRNRICEDQKVSQAVPSKCEDEQKNEFQEVSQANPQSQQNTTNPFLSQKSQQAHFCSKNQNIRALRKKIVKMLRREDEPQVVPACSHG